LSADVETVFTDETSTVSAYTAVFFLKKKEEKKEREAEERNIY